MRHRGTIRAVLCGALLAAAGCGGGGDSWKPPVSFATSDAPSPSAMSSTPAASSGGTHVVVDGTFQTAEGYRYELRADLTLLAPTKSVVNDQPGFATILREYDPDSYWNLHNLLPDREAPLDLDSVYQLAVHGLFRASRPVCQGIRTQYEITLNDGGKTCSLRFGYLVRGKDAPRGIEPDGTAAGTYLPSDLRITTWTMRKVPETQVDAVMRDLEQGPDSTAVMIEDASTVVGWRTPFGGFGNDACLVEPNGVGSAGMILFFFNGTKASGLSRHTACHG